MDIGILGVGLIGGSIGAAARRAGHRVTGFDISGCARALELGVIDRSGTSPPDVAAASDLVVLATPGAGAVTLLRDLAEGPAFAAIVTDVTSTKRSIVAEGERLFGARFVGGHPMAGSERHGVDAADPDLFDGASWILTPTHATSSAAYQTVSTFVAGLGATPVALDPQAHDELLARLSHLPQIVAAAVVTVATSFQQGGPLLGLAAGGFRDVTRIAASHPDMWVDILRSNREAIVEALDDLIAHLQGVGERIAAGDWDGIRAGLDGARRARSELFVKDHAPADSVTLSLLIPDRPGVLAEVTTAAGELGANIEDLQIYHSTEGGRGRLDLVIAGARAADNLLRRLESLGYHVNLGRPE